MAQKEAKFQKKFIDDLKKLRFKCIRVKSSGNVNKSYPDYAVFYRRFWAWLEFKKSEDAEHQPGQDENVKWAEENSFGAFVYPENAEEILKILTYYQFREDEPLCDLL